MSKTVFLCTSMTRYTLGSHITNLSGDKINDDNTNNNDPWGQDLTLAHGRIPCKIVRGGILIIII